MSAMIAVPILGAEAFPQFIDSQGINKSATRWLFYPGDVIPSRRKRELKDKIGLQDASHNGFFNDGKVFRVLGVGGEEVGADCLARTKHAVPRCMLTPLEVAAAWTPPEMIPAGSDLWRGAELPAEYKQNVEYTGWTKAPLPGVKTWPGEAIRAILSTAMNDLGLSKGLIEVEALIGTTWQQAIEEHFQDFFFPGYPGCMLAGGKPLILTDIEEALRGARGKVQSGSMLNRAADEMLSACDQFRLWAYERIGLEEKLVAQPGEKGFSHKFSEVAESLMVQVDYTPEKRKMAQVTEQTAELTNAIAQLAAAKPATDNSALLAEALNRLTENQVYLMQAVANLAGVKPEPDEKPKTPQIPKVK